MKKHLFAAIIVSSFCSTAQVNLSSSLTACYSLNGNATDPINSLSGMVYSVTVVNDRNNNPGAAIEFAGDAGSYVALPNSPLLQSTVAVSFSGWVNATAFQANDFLVF